MDPACHSCSDERRDRQLHIYLSLRIFNCGHLGEIVAEMHTGDTEYNSKNMWDSSSLWWGWLLAWEFYWCSSFDFSHLNFSCSKNMGLRQSEPKLCGQLATFLFVQCCNG